MDAAWLFFFFFFGGGGLGFRVLGFWGDSGVPRFPGLVAVSNVFPVCG